MRVRGWLVGVAALIGCDGGGDAGIASDATCAVAVAVSGELAAEVKGSAGPACTSQLGSEGLDFQYILLEGDIEYVEVVVDAVTVAETGSFPATVRIVHRDGRKWSAGDCSAEIDEHTFLEHAELGERFRVHGVMSCAAPATSETAGSVTIEPFEFVVSVTWTG